MAFAKTNKSQDAVKDGGNSKYISKSGIYDVNLIAPFVSTGNNGALTVDLFLDNDGQQQPLYGNLRITNNDGNENKIGMETFNKLCVIAGVDEVSDPIEAELPMGKAGADKDAAVLEGLCDIELKVRVQMEYAMYQGKVTEKKVIKGFYRADGASAAEVVAEENGEEVTIGTQLEKDLAYAENITYKDGLDAEQVATWISGGRGKGTGGATGGAKAATPAAKKPSFAKKK